MSDSPLNFEDYKGNQEYTPGGRNFGNPMINLMMQLAFGQNYLPSPENGESPMDAFHRRERTTDAMGLQRSAFANSQLFKQLGVAGNPMLNVLGQFAGSPDSLAGQIMDPILGGNPMAASMQLYAGLGGSQALDTFGRTGSVSGEETESVMHALAKNMYKTEKYEQEGGGGGRDRMIQENKKMLIGMAGSEQGRKNIKDMLGVDVSVDKQGNISEKSRKELEAVDLTAGEQKEGMKSYANTLENNMESRALTSNNLSEDLSKTIKNRDEKIAEALKKDAKTKKEDLEKIAKKQEEDFRKKLNTEAKFSPDEIVEMTTGGQLDPEKVTKALNDYKRPDAAESKYLESKRAQAAGESFRGYDFAKSRGFKLEDFTSSFVEASKVGLLGNRKGQSIASTMEDFSANGGRALDAARSIFGKDKSGKELTDAVSKMVGNTADLGSESGSKEIEDLLRKTKVTAKAAGVSIKSMLGIIDSVRELAAQNPQLQHMSATGTTELAIGAVRRSAYTASGMTSTELRQAGGRTGLTAKDAQTTLSFAESKAGSGLAALLSSVAGDKTKTKSGKDKSEYIKDLVKEGRYTPGQLNSGLTSEIAEELGVSLTNVNNIMNNAYMGKMGMKNDAIAKFMGGEDTKKSIVGAAYEQLRNVDPKHRSKEEFQKEFKEFSSQNPNLTAEDFITKNAQYFDPKFLETYGSELARDLTESRRDPKEKERYAKRLDRMQKAETEIAEKYAGTNAPLATQFIGALAESKGAGTQEMVESVTKLLSTPGSELGAAAQEAGKNIARLSGSKEFDKEAGANINTVIKARKERAVNALAKGDNSEETKRLAKELGEIDDKKITIEDAAKALKDNPSTRNAEEARARLEELEKQETTLKKKGKKLDAPQQKVLEALRKYREGDVLKDDQSYKTALKGTKSAYAAAVLQSEVSYQQEQQLGEIDRAHDKELGTGLQELAADKTDEQWQITTQGDSTVKEALKSYGNDATKLRKDYLAGKGKFESREFREAFEKSGAGKLTTEAADSISHDREAYLENKAIGGKGKADPQTELMRSIADLTSAILGGGKISEALDKLATALNLPSS